MTLRIYFSGEGVTVEPQVAPEGRFFRLLQQPPFIQSATIYDLIEVREEKNDEVYEVSFVRVVEASGWRTFQTLLSEEQTLGAQLWFSLRMCGQMVEVSGWSLGVT
jgi:hypothetical protein